MNYRMLVLLNFMFCASVSWTWEIEYENISLNSSTNEQFAASGQLRLVPSKCSIGKDCLSCLEYLKNELDSAIISLLTPIKIGLEFYRNCITKESDRPTEAQELKVVMERLMSTTWLDPLVSIVFNDIVAVLEKAIKDDKCPKVIRNISAFYNETQPNSKCSELKTSDFAPVLNENTESDCLESAEGRGRSKSCLFIADSMLQRLCTPVFGNTGQLSTTRVETYNSTFFNYLKNQKVVQSRWIVTFRTSSNKLLPPEVTSTILIPYVVELFGDFSQWPEERSLVISTQQQQYSDSVIQQNLTLGAENSTSTSSEYSGSSSNKRTFPVNDPGRNQYEYRCIPARGSLFHIWNLCISTSIPNGPSDTLKCVCTGTGSFSVIQSVIGYLPDPEAHPTDSPPPVGTTKITTPAETTSNSFTTTTDPDTKSTTVSDPPATHPVATTTAPSSGVSPILTEIIANYTANNTEWITDSPGLVLEVVKNLTHVHNRTKELIDFDNVIIVGEIIDNVVISDPNLSPNVTATVDTMLDIYDIMLQWNTGTSLTVPTDEHEARKLEQQLYEALEVKIPAMLPSRPTPFEFYKTLISVNILKMDTSADQDFEAVQISGLKNTIIVDAFQTRDALNSSYKFLSDGEAELGLVADFRLSVTSLKTEFESVQASSGTFTVILSSLERFRYAPFDHSQVLHRNSKSQKISPIMFIGKLSQTAKPEGIVTFYRTQADELFKTPEGKRYRGSRYYECIYLDYNLTAEIGGWSKQGCRSSGQYNSWEKGTTVECECDHLTPFTVFFYMCDTLMDLDAKERPSVAEQFGELEPRMIAAFSLSISIICITIVLLHSASNLYRKILRITPLNFVRLNVVSSLLVSNISFLVAEYVPESESQESCFAIAFLSHWFMLSSFFWMSAETYFLIKIIAGRLEVNYSNRDNFDGARWRVSLIAWGIPLAFPFISSISHIESVSETFGGQAYGSSTLWCWIDPQHHGYFLATFVIPICVIALVNLSVFAYYLYKRREAEIDAGQKRSIRQGTISVVGSCFLLGGTWLIAYLMLMMCCDDIAKKVAGVFYIILNGAQGMFVLWVYISRLDGGYRHLVRDAKRIVRYLSSRISHSGHGTEIKTKPKSDLSLSQSSTPLPSVSTGFWRTGPDLHAMFSNSSVNTVDMTVDPRNESYESEQQNKAFFADVDTDVIKKKENGTKYVRSNFDLCSANPKLLPFLEADLTTIP